MTQIWAYTEAKSFVMSQCALVPYSMGKGLGKGLKYSSATKALTHAPPPPNDAQWTIIQGALSSLSVVVHGTWRLWCVYTKINTNSVLTVIGRGTASQPQLQKIHDCRHSTRRGMGYPNCQRYIVSDFFVAGVGSTYVLTISCPHYGGSTRKWPQRCDHNSNNIVTSGKRCAMDVFISGCSVTISTVSSVVTVGGNTPFNQSKIGSHDLVPSISRQPLGFSGEIK